MPEAPRRRRRAGVTVRRAELRVANTGAPLTAAGVAALASLRASAKRDDAGAVGRFGVGFAAVLAVSDAPRVVSTSGAVAFSAARTAEAVADLPGPAAELARRDAPPVLRLVWPSAEHPPAGFATEVRLPLRAGVDGAALLAHARSAASDLLLALPALVEIDVDGHVVRRCGAGRRRHGRAAAVAGGAARRVRSTRPTPPSSSATAGSGSVTWALPLSGALGDDVAHAPTATAEALALPARLIATLPLEPDRRRVRLGPVTDAVLDGAAAAYVDLVRSVAPDERLALVPRPGFPRSPLDGAAARPDRRRPARGGLAPGRVPSDGAGAAGRTRCPAAAGWTRVPAAAGWEQVVPRLRLGARMPAGGSRRVGSAGSPRCRARARPWPGRVARHPRPRPAPARPARRRGLRRPRRPALPPGRADGAGRAPGHRRRSWSSGCSGRPAAVVVAGAVRRAGRAGRRRARAGRRPARPPRPARRRPRRRRARHRPAPRRAAPGRARRARPARRPPRRRPPPARPPRRHARRPGGPAGAPGVAGGRRALGRRRRGRAGHRAARRGRPRAARRRVRPPGRRWPRSPSPTSTASPPAPTS